MKIRIPAKKNIFFYKYMFYIYKIECKKYLKIKKLSLMGVFIVVLINI